jgi:hypothetical protein
LVSIKLN